MIAAGVAGCVWDGGVVGRRQVLIGCVLDMGESFRQQVSITTNNTSIGEVYFVGVSAGSIFKENASDY